jgi:hypothetical protein
MEAVEVSAVMEDFLPVPAPELPPDRFLDRELSWLAFNERVLDLAKDAKRVPLLERAKFLAIFSSNWTSSTWSGSPAEAPHGSGCRSPHGERDDAPRGALGDPQPDPGDGH